MTFVSRLAAVTLAALVCWAVPASAQQAPPPAQPYAPAPAQPYAQQYPAQPAPSSACGARADDGLTGAAYVTGWRMALTAPSVNTSPRVTVSPQNPGWSGSRSCGGMLAEGSGG